MVTEVAVPSALAREGVGVGDAGGELVVRAGRRRRSRRRWRRSRTCRNEPAVPAGRNVAALSMSLTVSVPEVLMSAAALVSVRLRTSPDTTAPSLVPRMLMVTEVAVPSLLSTPKLSV